MRLLKRVAMWLGVWRETQEWSADSLLNLLAVSAPDDYTGVPTRQCMCGCDLILVPVVFDKEREIAGYVNTGFCSWCGAMLTVVTAAPAEVDKWTP